MKHEGLLRKRNRLYVSVDNNERETWGGGEAEQKPISLWL